MMVPFWIPIIVRHPIFRGTPKGVRILTAAHVGISENRGAPFKPQIEERSPEGTPSVKGYPILVNPHLGFKP